MKRLGEFMQSGEMKGVQVKYTASEFRVLTDLIDGMKDVLANWDISGANKDMYSLKLQLAVLNKLAIRLRKREVGMNTEKPSIRYDHDEALTFIIMFSNNNIRQAFEDNHSITGIVDRTILELYKQYA